MSIRLKRLLEMLDTLEALRQARRRRRRTQCAVRQEAGPEADRPNAE